MRIFGEELEGVQSHVVRLNVAEGPLQNSRRRRLVAWPPAERHPDPEVTDKPKRRRFTVEYKLSLLKKADAYRHQPGKVGALLRREGVYSSTLSQWRRQREEGTLSALKPKRRGRKIQEVNPLAGRVTELEREVQQLHGKLRQAETIIDVQKKTLRARVSSDESPGELKQRMMTAAQELSRKVGVRAACEALEVSPATFYRRRQSSSASKPSSGRASSPRALRRRSARGCTTP